MRFGTDGTVRAYSVDGLHLGLVTNTTAIRKNVTMPDLDTTGGGHDKLQINSSTGEVLRRTSLRERKKDITPVQTMLDLLGEENPIYALSPVVFREQVSDKYPQTNRGQFVHGFIAEDVKDVMPELATVGRDGELFGYSDDGLIALLVAEVQRLGGIVHKLQLAADPNWVKPAERTASSAAAELAVLQAEQARLRALPAEEE